MQIFKFLRSFVRATKIVSYGVQTTVFFFFNDNYPFPNKN